MMTLKHVQAIVNYHLGRARFLFIHIPKNAGVTVRNVPALRSRIISADPHFHISRAYTRAVSEFMRERGEHHGHQHARLRDIHPDVLRRVQPVAVVRNPWARTVSRYRFAQTAIEHGKTSADYVAPSFEAFLEERLVYGDMPYYWHRAIRGWYPQLDYVTTESGAIAAHVLRFEHLEDELKRYFQIRELTRPRNVSTALPKDWRSFYNPRTIQIVADWYRRDIDSFGFDFDTPARKQTYFSAP